MNVNEKPKILKVTLNMGLGESGERYTKAEKLLGEIAGQKPVRRLAHQTNRDFKIRKNEPIGLKVTLRKQKALAFLKRALEARAHTIPSSCFDERGNLSFGIKEHIDLPGVRYDPGIGIYGLDVCISLGKPGNRIRERRVQKKRIKASHHMTHEESVEFMRESFGVKIA
jgi:large subunit ribosomal protein L5